MMPLHVALLPAHLPPNLSDEPTLALCIDTLRFTTTACQALVSGAEAISVAAEITEVRELARKQIGLSRLCGERLCKPIDGFDLGNSPLEYTPKAVQDAHLLFSTTNGTLAVQAAQDAEQIWLAALVNRAAVCRALLDQDFTQCWIVCAGTDGAVAMEDVLTAGAILKNLDVAPSNDAGQLALAAWQNVLSQSRTNSLTRELVKQFSAAAGGANLIDTGFQADLDFAATLDSIDLVPANRGSWRTFQPLGESTPSDEP